MSWLRISGPLMLLGLTACGAEPKPEPAPTAALSTTASAMASAAPSMPSVGGGAAPSAPEVAQGTPPEIGAGAAPSAPVVGGAAPAAPAVERVEVAVGATFDVRLPANATTGYQWKVQGPLDAHLLLVSENYEMEPAPPGGERMVGRGGTAHFVFKGASAGEATLVLGYARPWEKGPAETIRTWQVVVK